MNVRQELERLMRATLADRANWTYRAVRPMPVPPSWHPGQKVIGDCSKAVAYLCRWANGPDPMNNDWGTWGNSTTLAATLEHLLAPAALRPGDIVTFGPSGTQHAAMVLEPGIDPLLWSFGHQGAPNTYRLWEDKREHQLLRLPVVDATATPSELRARTGYWSWLAWRLGEQAWKPYGPRNPKVRPNVPRMIPAEWWAEWLTFVLARKKPNPPKGNI